MAEQQGIQVSRARVHEILANKQANYILQLQQEVAQLTAVNEALMERLNDRDHGDTQGQALSEGIDSSGTKAP